MARSYDLASFYFLISLYIFSTLFYPDFYWSKINKIDRDIKTIYIKYVALIHNKHTLISYISSTLCIQIYLKRVK